MAFERAAETFMDPLAISIYDEEHSREEDADTAVIRMISARRATRKEIKQYEGDKP